MAHSREVLLFEKLAKAFRPQVGGQDIHAKFVELSVSLKKETEEKTIEATKRRLGTGIDKSHITHFSPEVYNLIWNEFCKDKKITSYNALTAILALAPTFVRIARSLDFLEGLEAENQHYEKLFDEKAINLREAEDSKTRDVLQTISDLPTRVAEFETTCKTDLKAHIQQMTANHLQDQLESHLNEIKKLDYQLSSFESKLQARNPDANRLAAAKAALLKSIDEKKAELKSYANLYKDRQYDDSKLLPPFYHDRELKKYKQEFDKLCEDFADANDYFQEKTKRCVPVVTAQHVSYLQSIQQAFAQEKDVNKKFLQEKKIDARTFIEMTINAQQGYFRWTKYPEWDELKAVVLAQYSVWTQESEILTGQFNVGARARRFIEKRDALVEVEKKRIEFLSARQTALHNTELLAYQTYGHFCTAVNADIRTAYKKNYQDNKQKSELAQQYDQLKTRLEGMKVENIQEAKQKNDSHYILVDERTSTRTPERRAVPAQQPAKTSSGATKYVGLSLLKLGAAAACFFLVTPPLGWGLAAGLGFLGLCALGKACYNYCTRPSVKEYSKKTLAVRKVGRKPGVSTTDISRKANMGYAPVNSDSPMGSPRSTVEMGELKKIPYTLLQGIGIDDVVDNQSSHTLSPRRL